MKIFQNLFISFFILLATIVFLGCGSDSSPSPSTSSLPETFGWLQKTIHDSGYAEMKEIYSPSSSYTTRKDELSIFEGDSCSWQICSYEINTKDKVGGEINYFKNHHYIFSAQDIDPDSIMVYPYQGLGFFNVEMRTLEEKKLIHWRDKKNNVADEEWEQSKSQNANFVIGKDKILAEEAANALKNAVLDCQNRPRPLLTSLSIPFTGPVQPCLNPVSI